MFSVLALMLSVLPVGQAAPLFPEGTLGDALAQAKDTKKPLLIDVFATWCGPCQKLDREVFPTKEVQAEGAHFVTLKVNAETPAGEEVVARYHVVGFPTVLIVTPSGEEVDRIFGFKPAAEFASTLRDYRNGKNTYAALKQRMAAHPDDLQLRFEVGKRAAVRGLEAEAKARLEEVIAADPDNKKGLAATSLLTLGKYLHLRGKKDYVGAEKMLRDVRKRFPKSAEAKRSRYPLARALKGQGRGEEALAELQALIDEDPTRSGAYNTFAWFCFRERFAMDKGIASARAGLKRHPKDSGLWDTLAELHFASGDHNEALTAAKKALSLDPKDPYLQSQVKRFASDHE